MNRYPQPPHTSPNIPGRPPFSPQMGQQYGQPMGPQYGQPMGPQQQGMSPEQGYGYEPQQPSYGPDMGYYEPQMPDYGPGAPGAPGAPGVPGPDADYGMDPKSSRLEREIVEINRRINSMSRRLRRIEDFLNIRDE